MFVVTWKCVDYDGERIRSERRAKTISADRAGNFIPVLMYKTQPWEKPSSRLSHLHRSNVKARGMSAPVAEPADAESALHMAESAQPKRLVILIPHGSLR